MFDNLSDKILSSLKKIRGQGKITPENIEAALKEIRLALLEADVNFKVVKQFIEKVQQKAVGQNVVGDISAGQQIVKIVHDELVELLGGKHQELDLNGPTPHVILMVGLQGAGKTTTSGKLAQYIKKKGRNPLLVPADVYRPAAIDQLKVVGKQVGADVFPSTTEMTPQKITQEALSFAKANGKDILIIDTAGRLQIDDALMDELRDIKKLAQPKEILFVADSMTGQDAVNVAQGFHDKLNITGVVLTKMDGDARGGAALSIKYTIGIPIKFVGVSEKMDGLDAFHPERIAGRILDMGDMVSLVEKAGEVFEESQAVEMEKKIRKNQFTLEDFAAQMKQIKKLGPLEGVLKMLPGMGQLSKQMQGMTPPEDEMKKFEAIISSMTLKERRNYQILNGSRRSRIAKGSGTQVSDINRFIRQFEQAQKMMQMFSKMKGRGGGLPF